MYGPLKTLSSTLTQVVAGVGAAERVFELEDRGVPPDRGEAAPPLRRGLRIEDTAHPVRRGGGAAGAHPRAARGQDRRPGRCLGRRQDHPLRRLAPLFVDPVGGADLWDGQDVRGFTRASLRAASPGCHRNRCSSPARFAMQSWSASPRRRTPRSGARSSGRTAPSSSGRSPGAWTRRWASGARSSAGAAAAAGHRPGVRSRAVAPASRRAHQQPRRGERGAGPGGPRQAEGRPHHAGHRPPPLHRAPRRPDRRPRGGSSRRAGNARPAHGTRHRLSEATQSGGRRWAGVTGAAATRPGSPTGSKMPRCCPSCSPPPALPSTPEEVLLRFRAGRAKRERRRPARSFPPCSPRPPRFPASGRRPAAVPEPARALGRVGNSGLPAQG